MRKVDIDLGILPAKRLPKSEANPGRQLLKFEIRQSFIPNRTSFGRSPLPLLRLSTPVFLHLACFQFACPAGIFLGKQSVARDDSISQRHLAPKIIKNFRVIGDQEAGWGTKHVQNMGPRIADRDLPFRRRNRRGGKPNGRYQDEAFHPVPSPNEPRPASRGLRFRAETRFEERG